MWEAQGQEVVWCKAVSLKLLFLFPLVHSGATPPVEGWGCFSAGPPFLTLLPGKDGPRSPAPAWIRTQVSSLLPCAPALCPSSHHCRRVTRTKGARRWLTGNKQGSSSGPLLWLESWGFPLAVFALSRRLLCRRLTPLALTPMRPPMLQWDWRRTSAAFQRPSAPPNLHKQSEKASPTPRKWSDLKARSLTAPQRLRLRRGEAVSKIKFCTQAVGAEVWRRQAKEKSRDRAKVRHPLCMEAQTASWPKEPAAEELETLLQADWINSVKLQRHLFQMTVHLCWWLRIVSRWAHLCGHMDQEKKTRKKQQMEIDFWRKLNRLNCQEKKLQMKEREKTWHKKTSNHPEKKETNKHTLWINVTQ